MNNYLDDSSLESLVTRLNQIDKEDTPESYSQIKEILFGIEFPLPLLIIPKGRMFVRNRVHTNGETFFRSINEISYQNHSDKIKNFGRANEPNQAMFYCSDNEHTAYCESSEIVKGGLQKQVEYITSSYWTAVEDINVINILTNEKILGKNLAFDNLSMLFQQQFQNFRIEEVRVVLKFLNFLSENFTRKSTGSLNGYKVSCALTNYVLNIESNPKIDGLIYPSVILTEEGLNYAFRPTSVDKKLQFHSARRIKMEKIGSKDYFETESICSEIHDGKGFEIKW